MRAAGTQIVCVSGPADVLVAAAAAEAGLLPRARRRVLLVCDDAPVPEAAPPWDEVPGFARLRARFDAVLSWNEAIRPFHPAAWTPRTEDVPLLERHFRKLWGLGDGRVELVLGAPDTAPAQSVARVFTGAPLHVYTAGPAGYGPTRGKLDPLIGTRVRQVLHLDLVPGLTPLLLGEFGAPARAIPADAFRAVAKEVAPAVTGVPEGAALVVGSAHRDRAGAEDAPHAEMVASTAAAHCGRGRPPGSGPRHARRRPHDEDRPAMNTALADDRSAVTGRRRIAFAVRTDAAGLPGTAALLRSLALAAPDVCEDVVVLHLGLPDEAFDVLRRLPRGWSRAATEASRTCCGRPGTTRSSSSPRTRSCSATSVRCCGCGTGSARCRAPARTTRAAGCSTGCWWCSAPTSTRRSSRGSRRARTRRRRWRRC
ncbi:hypothetical protein SALBM217S_05751 [Streptomyces griseoloalbus]